MEMRPIVEVHMKESGVILECLEDMSESIKTRVGVTGDEEIESDASHDHH